MRRLAFSIAVAVPFATACAGDPPRSISGDVDAGVDAPPAAVGQRVSGKAMDYFGAVALADSTVTTDGIDPAKMATSAADGTFTLDDVPVGSKVFLTVAHANYRPTRNVATPVADADVVQDIYVLSTADVTRQYTTLGRAPLAGTAFVAVELQRNNGTPLEGVALDAITLLDGANQPVPNVVEVFFGAAGDVDPALTTATAFGGRSRIALLDVPAGNYTLTVDVPNGQGGITTITTTLATVENGATLALSGGGGGGADNLDPAFATDIYPRLQRAALGGTGCANCHTAGGPGAILILDAPAADVLASLLPAAVGGRIDTTTPANSLLLTKPLYERTPPQNHPNATFLDENDPDYKLILRWITNGLKP